MIVAKIAATTAASVLRRCDYNRPTVRILIALIVAAGLLNANR
jgi:hypothetical protein